MRVWLRRRVGVGVSDMKPDVQNWMLGVDRFYYSKE